MKDMMPHDGKFDFWQLPYEGLGGAVSAQTLAFHHGKHLKAYVDNLNRALEGSPLAGRSLTEVVRQAEGPMLNNAGQVLNHVMYFEQFAPAGAPMSDAMRALLERDFGSVEAFRAEMEQKGASLFGSGWVWLAQRADGTLAVTQEPNAGNPVRSGLRPLMTFDVWEHAYYLDYQNRRADYLAALWAVVDWRVVEGRLA